MKIPCVRRATSAYLRRRAATLLRKGALREVTFSNGWITGPLPGWLAARGVLDAVAPICHANSQEPCPICLEDFAEDHLQRCLPCGHGFHAKCIEGWVVRGADCPLCRVGIQRGRTMSEARVETLEIWQLRRLVRVASKAVRQAEEAAVMAGRAEGRLQRRQFWVM